MREDLKTGMYHDLSVTREACCSVVGAFENHCECHTHMLSHVCMSMSLWTHNCMNKFVHL
jgi:hypothetical protein